MPKTLFPKLRSELEMCDTLYLAIEMSDKSWVLGFATAKKERTRVRQCEADSVGTVLREIETSRQKFGLPEDCRVVVAYEAGFSGFWLARALEKRGPEVIVLPSTILEDTGGKRRRKTDLLDVRELLSVVIRYDYYEEKRLLNPVVVPTAKIEDACRIHRERGTLKTEILRHKNRIRGLLRYVGERPLWKNKDDPIPQGIPPRLESELRRELVRLRLAEAQFKQVEAKQLELLKTSDSECARRARVLQSLVAIGVQGGWVLAHELYRRPFKNRRQVGAFAGLVSIPHQSGNMQRDGSISKAGNGRVRALSIELAWLWLRYQPESRLTKWYMGKFHGQRPRKIGIVALARKLLIALWQFVEHGIVPDGARIKVEKLASAC